MVKKRIKMKKYIMLSFAALFLFSAMESVAQDIFDQMVMKAKPRIEKAEVSWSSSMKHDFGQINQDFPVVHKFEFTNTSNKAITLDNVRTSCGCAAPSWTYDPIPPGESSMIEIEFNAAKEGEFVKLIKVFVHDVKKPEILTITGEVIPTPVSDADWVHE